MPKILQLIKNHKIIFFIAVALLAGGGFLFFRSSATANAQTRYVLAAAEKGSLVTSLSGTGQVSASKQVDVKATVSGDVLSVNVQVGQEVKSGKIIAQLDSTSAQKSVRDAEASLESAKLSLEKLQEPADALSILQAENSLAQAQQTKTQAEENLKKAYQDGVASVGDIFTSLPNIMSGLTRVIVGSGYQWNIDYYANGVRQANGNTSYRETVSAYYEKANSEYDDNLDSYLATSRSSDNEDIESLLNETYSTLKDISLEIKSSTDLISYFYDVEFKENSNSQAINDSNLTSLNSYSASINSYLTSVAAAKNSITSAKQSVVNAANSISEKTESLAKLKADPEELDLRSAKLSVQQREDALADAKEKLNDYSIKAPFDGVVAALNVSQGDSIASISSYGTIATIITKNHVAEISLNEVDAVNVKSGQKVTLTFDAIDGLSLVGTVSEIDTIGTVSQGVVSYSVKIVFDTEDDRIRPGMSVSASIIVDSKQDVLLIPSSALKGEEGSYYVEVLDGKSFLGQEAASSEGIISSSGPQKKSVEIGLSDDTMVEITSGMEEGEMVVTKTVTQTVKSSSSQSQGIFSLFGGKGAASTVKSSSGTKSTTNSSGGMPSSPGGGGAGPVPGM